MTTSGNVCTVQRTTDRPQLGEKHLGPFNSKGEATTALCADVDETMTDTSRCFSTAPTDACKTNVDTLAINPNPRHAIITQPTFVDKGYN